MPRSKKATKKKASKKQRLVLLDAHAIIHRAYHALPDFTSPDGEPTGALYGLSAMLMSIIEQLQPDHLVAAYDLPKPTHRHEVFDEYKAGRDPADATLVQQIERSRDVFEAFGIPIYEKPGFEADDIIGTIVEKLKRKTSIEIIIASGDMDTLQLVKKKQVQVYTLRKGIKDTVMYDEKAVLERFGFSPTLIPDYKGLRGDPSDNIPGVPGVGEKTATTLVTTFGSVEDVYKTLKKDEQKVLDAKITPRIVGLLREHEEDAHFSKMLAEIRRDAPIAFELRETSWSERFDTDKILWLFAELGFKSLSDRLKKVFGITTPEPEQEQKQERSF